MNRVVTVTLWEDSPHAIEMYLPKHGWICRRLYPHELPEELRYKLALLTTAPDGSFDFDDEDNDVGWKVDVGNYPSYEVYVSKETMKELSGDRGDSGNT